jgi:hypothetical protein
MGGTTTTGGTATSGGTGTGAVPPGGASPGGGSGDVDDTAEPAGCGCRVGVRHGGADALLALFVALVAFGRRRGASRREHE